MILYFLTGGLLTSDNPKSTNIEEKKKEAGEANSAENKADDVSQLKERINEEKKKRLRIVEQLNMIKNKLMYKQAECEALTKLSELTRSSKSVGRLKRLKESIEFKIATEATTLNAERELIKKLSEINQDLEEALKTYRFKRKAELVSQDVEELRKKFESYRDQIREEDKALDVLYANLREVTGWGKKPVRKPRRIKQQEQFEISMEDIATIKNEKQSSGAETKGF